MKKLTYIQGAFILTMTNLITGILAFAYRMYLSRSIGAEGMGVFQLVMPLYMLMITLVSGGISTAVSKLVAESHASNNFKNIYKITRICFISIGGWSLLICMLIVFNADFVAYYILKDSRTVFSIMILTPAVFFVSMAAILKGYFYGIQNVKPPAVIDILEKIVRLGSLIAITSYLIPYGIAYVCAGAMLAMTAGEFLSLVLLYLTYRFRKSSKINNVNTESTISIIKKVLHNAIPLSISGALATIMDMLCAVLVPSILRKSGYSSSTALALYGQLTGMVMPLLFFPFIIVASLSITLVPAVTSSFTSKNYTALNKKSNDSLMLTTIVGFAATAFFLVYPSEACRIFFEQPQAGTMLFWMALGCVLEYWQFTLFAIMSGVGLQKKVLVNSVLHIFVTLACIYLLLPIPQIGIYGYIIGFNLSAVIVVAANLFALRKIPQIKIDFFKTVTKPFVCFSGLTVFLKYCNSFLISLGITGLNLTLTCIIGFFVYIFLLLLTGTLTSSQLKSNISFRN
ncbi:MAG: stage V sporulation protein B [Bacillota bacterium]